jgi:hypothetical protein
VHGVLEALDALGFGSYFLVTANAACSAYIETRARRCPRYEDERYNSARRHLRRSLKVLLFIALIWCIARVMVGTLGQEASLEREAVREYVTLW